MDAFTPVISYSCFQCIRCVPILWNIFVLLQNIMNISRWTHCKMHDSFAPLLRIFTCCFSYADCSNCTLALFARDVQMVFAVCKKSCVLMEKLRIVSVLTYQWPIYIFTFQTLTLSNKDVILVIPMQQLCHQQYSVFDLTIFVINYDHI